MPSWSLLISQPVICDMNEHVLVGKDLQRVNKLLPVSEKQGVGYSTVLLKLTSYQDTVLKK
jgi:hypothetical protein